MNIGAVVVVAGGGVVVTVVVATAVVATESIAIQQFLDATKEGNFVFLSEIQVLGK